MLKILQINELNGFSQFEDLRYVWNDILRKTKDNNIFSTWEWLSSWWKHFGEGRKLRILTIEDQNKILAIAPLMQSKYNFLRFSNLRKIEFIGSPQSDYNSLILTERETECLQLFLSYLIDRDSDWDYLELKDIPENTTSASLLQKISTEAQKFRNLQSRAIEFCPYTTLPDSTETFMKGLSRNFRRNLRRLMKRLEKEYHVEVKTHNDFSSIREAMNTFFELHQKRWESKGKLGVFSRKAAQDFHLDVARHFDEKGWLSLYFLTANGEPIASIYSFDYEEKNHSYLSGFDPRYYEYSPINLLRMCVIERCVEKGLKEHDLLRGNEPHKSKWCNKMRKNLEVRLVRGGLPARIYAWTTKNDTALLLAQKLGKSLTLKG